jgi:hypothetical protein
MSGGVLHADSDTLPGRVLRRASANLNTGPAFSPFPWRAPIFQGGPKLPAARPARTPRPGSGRRPSQAQAAIEAIQETAAVNPRAGSLGARPPGGGASRDEAVDVAIDSLRNPASQSGLAGFREEKRVVVSFHTPRKKAKVRPRS